MEEEHEEPRRHGFFFDEQSFRDGKERIRADREHRGPGLSAAAWPAAQTRSLDSSEGSRNLGVHCFCIAGSRRLSSSNAFASTPPMRLEADR